MKEKILLILTIGIVLFCIYQLACHPDYRRWHDADHIMVRQPDGGIVEGAGRWKSDTLMVTVEIDGTEYSTSWDNVVAEVSR